VKRTQQARRSTLAQILFGGDSKASEKKEPNNGNGKKNTRNDCLGIYGRNE
jgi:hypothetical protein